MAALGICIYYGGVKYGGPIAWFARAEAFWGSNRRRQLVIDEINSSEGRRRGSFARRMAPPFAGTTLIRIRSDLCDKTLDEGILDSEY